jgi:hypothetical protein
VNESGYQNFGLVHVTKDAFEVTVIDEEENKRFSHVVPAKP